MTKSCIRTHVSGATGLCTRLCSWSAGLDKPRCMGWWTEMLSMRRNKAVTRKAPFLKQRTGVSLLSMLAAFTMSAIRCFQQANSTAVFPPLQQQYAHYQRQMIQVSRPLPKVIERPPLQQKQQICDTLHVSLHDLQCKQIKHALKEQLEDLRVQEAAKHMQINVWPTFMMHCLSPQYHAIVVRLMICSMIAYRSAFPVLHKLLFSCMYEFCFSL